MRVRERTVEVLVEAVEQEGEQLLCVVLRVALKLRRHLLSHAMTTCTDSDSDLGHQRLEGLGR